MKRFLLLLPICLAAPLPAQSPHAGSLAVGVGFGFNTAGVLGVELSARYMATDRVALGCRVTRGWGLERACGANLYPFDRREWHVVAELGTAGHGPSPLHGEPVWTRTWFTNLGMGIEDQVENDAGGHYRDNRVHFTIGPSFVLAERRRVEGQPAVTRWGVSPRFFNHTELLLYPVLK
jgi:hypothetical protein